MMGTHPCGARFDLMLKFSSGADNPHEILLLPLEPDAPGAPPSLLVRIAPVALGQFETAAVLPQLNQSPNFRFVEIGEARILHRMGEQRFLVQRHYALDVHQRAQRVKPGEPFRPLFRFPYLTGRMTDSRLSPFPVAAFCPRSGKNYKSADYADLRGL
jgi:hypothetical protein